MNHLRSTLFVSSLLLVAAACGGDDDGGPTGPAIALETTVLDVSHIEAAATQTEGLAGRSSSQSGAQLAELGAIAPTALAGTELYTVQAGESTTIDYDVDGDGADETLDVFLVRGGPALLAWSADGRCHLTYTWNDIGWYFDAACGTDGALVCRYDAGTTTCQLCDAERCAPCTFDETEARKVACEEIEIPEPDVGVDAGTDIEQDVDEDPDTTTEDVGVDTPGTDVMEDPDTTTEDVVEDPDVSEGPCEASCMAAPGAVCCTGCGCSASDCLPVCNTPGYTWDCEVQCCFNYDLLECEGQE